MYLSRNLYFTISWLDTNSHKVLEVYPIPTVRFQLQDDVTAKQFGPVVPCISDPTAREVHKLVTYCVTMSGGQFITISLRCSFIVSAPFLLLFSSLFFSLLSAACGPKLVSYSYNPAPKSFRVNGATVENIQNQLLSLTIRPTCLLKGPKVVSIYF